MRNEIYLEIFGVPAPQGSKRHVGNGVMVESSKKVAPWRKAVAAAVAEMFEETGDDTALDGPLEVWSTFYLPRLPSVRRQYPTVPPDLDKLERGLFDALTIAGVWTDDSRVIRSHAAKNYADMNAPGAVVEIRVVDEVSLAIVDCDAPEEKIA